MLIGELKVGAILRNDKYSWDFRVVKTVRIKHYRTGEIHDAAFLKPITFYDLPLKLIGFERSDWTVINEPPRHCMGQSGEACAWLHGYKHRKPKEFDFSKMCMLPECDKEDHVIKFKSVANPNRTKK